MAKKKITLEFDQERLTLGDLLKLEEETSVRSKMDVLCKFVKNGTGDFLEPKAGFEALKELTISDLNNAAEQFKEAAQGGDDPK